MGYGQSLRKWVKSQVSEKLWRVNMLKGPKHCLNLHRSSFLYFLITLQQLQSENFFLSSI